MTNDMVQYTRIAEPSMTANEAEMLLFALARSRAQFAWKCGGLDAAGLHKQFPPSAMTLGGLLKHMALVEDRYTAEFLTGKPIHGYWKAHNFEADPDWDWHTAADGQPSAFVISTGESPNLRRVLTDLHDEYARHVGHADLFREAVDGLVGEDPPQPADHADLLRDAASEDRPTA